MFILLIIFFTYNTNNDIISQNSKWIGSHKSSILLLTEDEHFYLNFDFIIDLPYSIYTGDIIKQNDSNLVLISNNIICDWGFNNDNVIVDFFRTNLWKFIFKVRGDTLIMTNVLTYHLFKWEEVDYNTFENISNDKGNGVFIKNHIFTRSRMEKSDTIDSRFDLNDYNTLDNTYWLHTNKKLALKFNKFDGACYFDNFGSGEHYRGRWTKFWDGDNTLQITDTLEIFMGKIDYSVTNNIRKITINNVIVYKYDFIIDNEILKIVRKFKLEGLYGSVDELRMLSVNNNRLVNQKMEPIEISKDDQFTRVNKEEYLNFIRQF